MKKINKKAVFVLLALTCVLIFACYNPIMEKWWGTPEEETVPEQVEETNGSGVNFIYVFFDSNGGDPQPKPFRVLYGDLVPRIRAVTNLNPSLGLEGWVDEYGNFWDLDNRKVKQGDDRDGDGIITLTARWTTNFYTVNFVENYEQLMIIPANYPKRHDGTTVIRVDSQKIAYGGKVVEPAVIPTGTGHGLVGWYTQNGMDAVTKADKGDAYWGRKWDFSSNTVTANVTLHARWSLSTRTVHLQVNGGKRPDGVSELSRVNFSIYTGLGGTTGGKIIDPGPLVRQGYTFGGWYSDLSYSNEWNFSTSKIYGVDSDIPGQDPFILYAKWVPNIYFVTFVADGGTPAPTIQNVAHGERVAEPPIMTKTGQAFTGWYSDAGLWKFDTNTVTSNLTLTAKWEVAVYTVTFVLRNPPNGLPSNIVQPLTQRVIFNGYAKEPFMPATPTSESNKYSFYRWDRSNDGGGTFLTFSFNAPITENITLYARWVEPKPDMVWVPKGSFIMGDSGVSGSPATYHAYPTRAVALDGFYISKYEVTQFNDGLKNNTIKGYRDLMGVNPSQFTYTVNRPVDRVSWFDAVEYCIKLTDDVGLSQVYSMSSITRTTVSASIPFTTISGATVSVNWNNNGFRLPTEAEWEYAAREGNNSPGNFVYAGSNDPNSVAWYNTTVQAQPSGNQATQTVGIKAPNALGIYDMSGNVSEWVWDWFGPYKDSYFSIVPDGNVNPRGPPSGTERVRRGGGWSNAVGNVRSVVRNSDTPDKATWVNGFRVVRGPSMIW